MLLKQFFSSSGTSYLYGNTFYCYVPIGKLARNKYNQSMSRKHPTPESFEYALSGIKTAIKNEPNFKFQLIVAFLTLALGYYLQLSTTEFAILILVICMVLVLELINTALESLIDISSPDIHPKAKIAKDVAAASVLIAALTSIFIGVLLFLPKIL